LWRRHRQLPQLGLTVSKKGRSYSGVRCGGSGGTRVRQVILSLVACAVAASIGSGSAARGAAALASNGMIAFARRTPGTEGGWSLMTINPDGSGKKVLADGAFAPVWSPSGNRLAYQTSAGDIWVMDWTGDHKLQLTGPGTHGPAWSPDGSKIAYIKELEGNAVGSLWETNADGTGTPTLIYAGAMTSAAWGPAKVAVAGGICGGQWGIYLMNADGTGCQVVPTTDTHGPSSVHVKGLSWTPDGTKIAYSMEADYLAGVPGCGGTCFPGNVFVADPYTGPLQGDQLTNFGAVLGAGGLSPSPDGTELVVSAAISPCQAYPGCWDSRPREYLMSVHGGPLTPLTDPVADDPAGQSYDDSPSWQPCITGVTTMCISVALPKAQTITFGALAGKTFGDADFPVSATSSSGLPVSFAASGSCTISAATIHLTGAGSCTVTASQAGDANYAAATPLAQTFAIAKANQTITFDSLGGKRLGDADFGVSATASSGLNVSFAATGNCAVSGTTVHLTGAGSCTITASQAGNTNYNAAAEIAQSFSIARAVAAARCTVPKVVGERLVAAKSALRQHHCGAGHVRYTYSRKVKKGRVTSQTRRPGLKLPAGSNVGLVVSRGRKR
jgi:WD40 repeat protein